MRSIKWINKLQKEKGDISDYKVAQLLKVTRQSISGHKNNKIFSLNDKQCLIIANELNIDPMIIISDQNLERAKTEEDISFWQNAAKKLKDAEECILCKIGSYKKDVNE